MAEYVRNDYIKSLLAQKDEVSYSEYKSQQWLEDSAPKRLMYYHLYGDILDSKTTRPRVLDVGGGFSSLTRQLGRKTKYTLMEIADPGFLELGSESLEEIELINTDWFGWFGARTWDIVIANDLFPNVDQRLGLFIEKYLPLCSEMRLTITVYDNQRYYAAKRLDGDEILTMLAWDGEAALRVLRKYSDLIDNFNDMPPKQSIFENGRRVWVVNIKGEYCETS